MYQVHRLYGVEAWAVYENRQGQPHRIGVYSREADAQRVAAALQLVDDLKANAALADVGEVEPDRPWTVAEILEREA